MRLAVISDIHGECFAEEAFQKGTFQGNVQLARKVLDTIAIIA